MRRKLAHFRRPEETSRGWPGDARVITPGPSRTVQFHAIEEIELPYGVPCKLQNGGEGFPAEYAAPVTTPNEHPTFGYFLSDPAPFQSYFKVHWEDMFGAAANLSQGTRRMSPLANPNAYGRAEGQATMAYNPWPAAGVLYADYPSAELKAV